MHKALCGLLPVQDDAAGWERWVYLFAQLRQLPALAPYIPTKEPRLRQTAYEMVLHAFLLSPADHPRLLDALQRWPPDLYSVPSLTQSVVQRYVYGHLCEATSYHKRPPVIPAVASWAGAPAAP